MAAEAAQPPNPIAHLQRTVLVTVQAVGGHVAEALQATGIQINFPRQLTRPARVNHHAALEEVVARVRTHVPCTAAEEPLRGKSPDVVLSEAMRRERSFDMIGAARCYSLLLSQSDSAFLKSPQGVETLCRVSKQLSDMGWQAYALAHGLPAVATAKPAYMTMEEGFQDISDAIELSEAALNIDPSSARAHLAVAFNSGRLALFTKNNRQKVQLCNRIRHEAEAAISLDPTDDIGWHILGRWHFEMASINPIVKLIVRNVYGGDVGGSHAEAVRSYVQAAALCPRRLTHHAELGKAYLKLGRRQEALEALDTALRCEVEDINAQNGRAHAAIIRSELVRHMRQGARGVRRDAAREAKDAAREARRAAADEFKEAAREQRAARKAEALARKAEKRRLQEEGRERKRLAKLSKRAQPAGEADAQAPPKPPPLPQRQTQAHPPPQFDREALFAAMPRLGPGGGKDNGSLLAAVLCTLSAAARARTGAAMA